MMMHGKWHLSCCVAKVLWVLSAVALVLAWVASANADGVVCLKTRQANGACPGGGLPVAHLFLDSLALGVLTLGLRGCMGCGKMMCAGGECKEEM